MQLKNEGFVKGRLVAVHTFDIQTFGHGKYTCALLCSLELSKIVRVGYLERHHKSLGH